ncbi:TSUP family transporter [Streptomyces sp. A7024]|uniref:Probable membrane transporter protein n=1 Tax=Streptomyces coryli TaxID=1128680 RepID=A0A6G4UDW2_9ACTN|nr:TSUP family transporter [Streptomyces coryli]
MAGVLVIGAVVQRVAGIGLGLLCVPPLVLLLGPVEGVSLSNVASAALSLFGLGAVWREVRLQVMVPLVAAAGVTVPAGAWVAHRLPEPLLLSGMGAVVTGAVLLVMRGVRLPGLNGTGGAMAAGAASGFMNSSAGVGGPAISLWALNAGWTARQFVPNALFYGVVVNALSVAAKGPPTLSGTAWGLIAAGIVAGGLIGRIFADRIPERPARRLLLLLALTGGVATLAKGLAGLV